MVLGMRMNGIRSSVATTKAAEEWMRTALMNMGKSKSVVERPLTNSRGESVTQRIALMPITRMQPKIFAGTLVFVSRRKPTENVKVRIVLEKSSRKS